MTEQTNFFGKLGKLDRRILFGFMILIQILILKFPIGLPTVIEPMVRDAFNAIDSVPEGSKIFIPIEIYPGAWGEVKPASIAVMRHVISKKLKFVMLTTDDQSPALGEELLRDLKPDLDKYGYEEGVDYIWCGFLAGLDAAAIGLAENFNEMVTVEAPILEDIQGVDDFYKNCCILLGGCGTCGRWVTNWCAIHDAKFVYVPMAKCAIDFIHYYTAGLFIGVVGGVVGGAQYEALIDRLDVCTSQNDMISLSILVNIAYLIIGNISYFGSKKGGRM